jgi:hypothetical protein
MQFLNKLTCGARAGRNKRARVHHRNWLTIRSGIVIKKKYVNLRYKSTKITE